jgi:hypothetical protein
VQPPRFKDESHKLSFLLAENENAGLACKADFSYLPVFPQQQGIIGGFGAAIFPAALGFGYNLFTLLDGGFVSFDLQTVFAGFQLRLAELRGLRNVDGLCERFCKRRHCQRDSGE